MKCALNLNVVRLFCVIRVIMKNDFSYGSHLSVKFKGYLFGMAAV